MGVGAGGANVCFGGAGVGVGVDVARGRDDDDELLGRFAGTGVGVGGGGAGGLLGGVAGGWVGEGLGLGPLVFVGVGSLKASGPAWAAVGGDAASDAVPSATQILIARMKPGSRELMGSSSGWAERLLGGGRAGNNHR